MLAMSRSLAARHMSIAAPAAKEQYRAAAEDRLLEHLRRVAEKNHTDGKVQEATEMYEHLVGARRAQNGDNHPLTVQAIGALARVACEAGEHSTAETLAREASATSKNILGALHPASLMHQSTLASVLAQQGKLDEAENHAREALSGFTTLFGDDHEDVHSARTRLHDVLSAQQGA